MANYLLDTGVIIRHLRGRRQVTKMLRVLGKSNRLSISVITRIEVRAGMQSDEQYATQKLLSRFITYSVDRDIADSAGDIIRIGRHRGLPLSVPDAIIAATAIRHHLILVTLNVKHFKEIPGLSLEPIIE